MVGMAEMICHCLTRGNDARAPHETKKSAGREQTMSSGLFSDLLVIDCASFIAGPAAGTVMSDFGARVIKIEPPGMGDSYRNLFRMRGTPEDIDYFWALDSRNKES